MRYHSRGLFYLGLLSEFDIAALVVYVGKFYTAAHQKKQWVFVTDGSISESYSNGPSNSLLAISFSSPNTDCDSFAPISNNLVGAAVGFCNLVKRTKDHINHLWVAEATENSTYFLSYDHVCCSHLKDAAASAERWAKISSSVWIKSNKEFTVGGWE
ncbi:Protein BREAST CANCER SUSCEPTIBILITY 2 B [Sarracenia purpurea var. burkii]